MDYLSANRAHWDEAVLLHLGSAFYDDAGFRAGRLSLSDFEVAEVGDVAGRELLHLQCHFGQDTLSWARLGARVSGLDFSAPAIRAARGLAADLGLSARFVCADVYDAPAALGATYDVVYTAHGVLCWLPDIRAWAAVVAALLRPGGILYLSDGHPLNRVFADTDEPQVAYDYFHEGPLRCDRPGTYAVPEAPTRHSVTLQYQHGLGQIVTALAANGLRVDLLRERPYELFGRFPWLRRRPDGSYARPDGLPRLPLLFSLRATKLP